MDLKKLIVILIVVCVIIVGAIYIYTNFANSDSEIKDNITNISSNMTDDVVNATLVSDDASSQSYSSSSSSDPEYGTDSYVERWDQSQRDGDSWAYRHDQPVKTDDDGNRYKRMYDEDTGESYWYNMDQNDY